VIDPGALVRDARKSGPTAATTAATTATATASRRALRTDGLVGGRRPSPAPLMPPA
jgi:hypothetical protein